MRPLVSVLSLLAATTLLCVALLALPAGAYNETDATGLRNDVRATWHEPSIPAAHTQWKGFLQLQPRTNVTAVHYQVCRVGEACFAPPTGTNLTVTKDAKTFAFDTSDYLANGKPVDYQGGWKIGVKWFLTQKLADGSTADVEFPHGPDLSSPECQGDAAQRCDAQHYFVFDMAPDASKRSPALAAPLALVSLVALALLLRQR